MNVLKPFLSPKKLRKLQNNPKAFFKDALDKRIIPIENQLKSLKPKKKHGFAEYYIISAVYNVEKYLDDYFSSILKQRLDFKNNIKIICVDDGSTDNSAKIIKNYQKRFPENIVYLHKENGGQASARNLGLQWLQEKLGYLEGSSAEITTPLQGGEADEAIHNPSYKPIWVTFTDPDDFLDRDYFYEVDRFLGRIKERIAVIFTNVIIYSGNKYIKHPTSFKFESGNKIEYIKNLYNEVQSSTVSLFLLSSIYKNKLVFNESEAFKNNFEDALFLWQYCDFLYKEGKVGFLKTALYYYRKGHNSSTSNFLTSISNFLLSIDNQKQEYLDKLKKVFYYINTDVILNFNLVGCWFYHKVGILNCFKGEHPPYQRCYVGEFDSIKKQVFVKYFTPNINEIAKLYLDGKEIYPKYTKIMRHNYLSEVFCYEVRLWIVIPQDLQKLEVVIGDKKTEIIFKGDNFESLNTELIWQSIPQSKTNGIWVFIDRDIEADESAEVLYRYISKNYPKQKIIFALDKTSLDWNRLQKDGFNLIDFNSYKFPLIAKKANKIISSHADQYFLRYFKKCHFIFLQHGIIKDDLSSWLNPKHINLFNVSTKNEFNSIVNDGNRYKFGKKEVKLLGLPRHDRLLLNSQKIAKIRQILIMPTWRRYLKIDDSEEKFIQSHYFLKWTSLLKNKQLQEITAINHYSILFFPHINARENFNKYFSIPDYIKQNGRDCGQSLSNLFCESSLMITDYSSVAFEMAYLKKPVLYYQFDEEDFFNLEYHSGQRGYFDYRKDGFGPVVTTEEELLKELEVLLQNDCKVGEPYQSNIENTFEFRDGKCCERVYRAILELDDDS
ncbi:MULTISPECIES: bifunctional glycosyltransferase/CDP-glycerol:glycerophosphate glycerophosphotransferase [Helicobacter]|uniref:bifunctional glycosyltransferase/CDP-glycerol:glycerophosphate glycerophosphotransferase n=1 Tax=Helicobacter TaxID=209 RepID=UPI002637B4A5|nr:CDP-glycerol glycerophosphotransferase family protein [Helicobacter sp. UBA3407]